MSKTGLIAAALIVAAALGANLPMPAESPAPAPDCLQAVSDNGESDWYCGDTVTIPPHLHIVAPMPACAEEDGSGTLPCRWDASVRGNGIGVSFTVLRVAQRVLIRYDNGVTVEN